MSFIPDQTLDAIHSRAAQYDKSNEFPTADIDALRECGYLSAFVPNEFGGAGLSLEQIAAEQTRLAQEAPATALAINMHQIIVGVGRYLVRHGVTAGEQILRGAVAGDLFAFGISEPGNDLVLFGSTTEAKPDPSGGYTFTGTKVFTSLAPAWTQLMTFGYDSEAGKSVFALLHREDGGTETKDDWDVVGMRATQSNTTLLKDAPAKAEQILGIVDPGPSLEPIVLGIFGNFEILLAATYAGIGLRAIDVAADHVKKRRSVKRDDVYATDPDIRWRLAEAALTMNAVGPQIRELAHDFDADVDYKMLWLPKLSAVKNASAEASLRTVEQCLRACGGASYYSSHELSRLWRDVLAGLFQPSDQESLHAAWANVVLG